MQDAKNCYGRLRLKKLTWVKKPLHISSLLELFHSYAPCTMLRPRHISKYHGRKHNKRQIIIRSFLCWWHHYLQQDPEQQIKHVRKVSLLSWRASASLKLKKYSFIPDKMNYLGLFIFPRQIEVALNVTTAIRELGTLISLTELRIIHRLMQQHLKACIQAGAKCVTAFPAFEEMSTCNTYTAQKKWSWRYRKTQNRFHISAWAGAS